MTRRAAAAFAVVALLASRPSAACMSLPDLWQGLTHGNFTGLVVVESITEPTPPVEQEEGSLDNHLQIRPVVTVRVRAVWKGDPALLSRTFPLYAGEHGAGDEFVIVGGHTDEGLYALFTFEPGKRTAAVRALFRRAVQVIEDDRSVPRDALAVLLDMAGEPSLRGAALEGIARGAFRTPGEPEGRRFATPIRDAMLFGDQQRLATLLLDADDLDAGALVWILGLLEDYPSRFVDRRAVQVMGALLEAPGSEPWSVAYAAVRVLDRLGDHGRAEHVEQDMPESVEGETGEEWNARARAYVRAAWADAVRAHVREEPAVWGD